MRVIIRPDYDKCSVWAANHIAARINAAKQTTHKPFVLGLPTGGTPLGTYRELISLYQKGKVSFENVITFNMDEYIGLDSQSPALFSSFLNERLFTKVPFKEVNLIDPSRGVEEEIERISSLIDVEPIDIVCLGIGQNGHLAFNDPPVADFNDPAVVKEVELDYSCKEQQVIDGCFSRIEDVPKTAITLTIPTLLSAKYLFCVVLGTHKSRAVEQTLKGKLSTEWPSTILRNHHGCIFYFDQDAYSRVN